MARIKNFEATEDSIVQAEMTDELNLDQLKNFYRSEYGLTYESIYGRRKMQQRSTDVNDVIRFTTGESQKISTAVVAKNYESTTFNFNVNVDFYVGVHGWKSSIITNKHEETTYFDLRTSKYNYIGGFDASQQQKSTTIIGSANIDNDLTVGQYGGKLWGGGRTTDIMTGSRYEKSSTEFYFGKTDGHDTIKTYSKSDSINLYDVTLADIAGVQIIGSSMELQMTTGSTLSIQSESTNGKYDGASTFAFADGMNVGYRAETQEFYVK